MLALGLLGPWKEWVDITIAAGLGAACGVKIAVVEAALADGEV